MNGRVGKDAEIGKFTYVDKLGSSLIDYVICSQSLINMFSSFDVDDPNILSDHCAVNFSL
jgi:exonuclease III